MYDIVYHLLKLICFPFVLSLSSLKEGDIFIFVLRESETVDTQKTYIKILLNKIN